MSQYEKLNPEIIYFMYSSKTVKWSTHEIIDFYSLVFVLDGSVTYFINDERFEMKQGDLVFIPPGYERKAYTSNMHYVAIDFTLSQDTEFPLSTVVPIRNMNTYIHYFDEFNTAWLQKGPEYKLKCKGILLMILHDLLCEKNQEPVNKNVELMKNYIMENYLFPISVNDIAEKMQMSPVYCGALFKKYENCSITNYISRIRINQAIALMETTNLNISEIAYQTGFNDIYYFSKTFKKILGITPSNFRNHTFKN